MSEMGESETLHVVAEHLATAYWALQDALTASDLGLAVDCCRDLQREARRLETLCVTHETGRTKEKSDEDKH